jgi:hypothetical protein
MKAEAKQAWITALMSGEYKQTVGFLCRMFPNEDSVRYCANGLLCVLANRNGTVESKWKDYLGINSDTSFSYLTYTENELAAMVPVLVLNWAGITDRELVNEIALMNDSGETFETIANWIANNVEGV